MAKGRGRVRAGRDNVREKEREGDCSQRQTWQRHIHAVARAVSVRADTGRTETMLECLTKREGEGQ